MWKAVFQKLRISYSTSNTNSAWDTVHLLREDYLHTNSFCKYRRKPAPLKSLRVLLMVQTADSGCARYRHRTILEVYLSQGMMTTWIVRGTPGLSFWQPQVDNRIGHLVLQVYVADDRGDHQTMSNHDVQNRGHRPPPHPFRKLPETQFNWTPFVTSLKYGQLGQQPALVNFQRNPSKYFIYSDKSPSAWWQASKQTLGS